VSTQFHTTIDWIVYLVGNRVRHSDVDYRNGILGSAASPRENDRRGRRITNVIDLDKDRPPEGQALVSALTFAGSSQYHSTLAGPL